MPNGAWNIRPARRSTMLVPSRSSSKWTIEKYESGWRDLLAAYEQSSAFTLVGCDADGSVVDFVSGGDERTGQLGCDGELYAIYVRPEAQRRGLGALLVGRFVHELITREFSSMACGS